MMPPTVILIRHAQALHNVDRNYDIPDPPLSDLGHKQCAALHEAAKGHPLFEKVEHIVVSPMRRTLQTALEGLEWLIERGVPIVGDADWQENSDKPCDTGTSLDQIAKEFPKVDFSQTDKAYPNKMPPQSNPYAFTRSAVLARGQRGLRNLYSSPHKVVAVVSHSGFLRCAISHTDYANADYRIFDFQKHEGKDGKAYVLEEWEETSKRGGGLGKSTIGYAGIEDTDFPAEEAKKGDEDAVMDKVESKQGERVKDEAAKEVPEER